MLLDFCKTIICLFLLFLSASTWAQDEDIVFDNKIYTEDIYTVQMYYATADDQNYDLDITANNLIGSLDSLSINSNDNSNGFNYITAQLSYPIISLNTSQQLVFAFDLLGEDAKRYVYTIQHCNPDWTPSDLTTLDYIDGFSEGEIENYDFSYNTVTPYTHYSVNLPNEDMKWTKSGNYLLKVYDVDNDNTLAITQRFMVYESLVVVTPEFVPSTENYNTHQEINFEVFYDKMPVTNPSQDFQAVVLQNNRWDNAIYIKQPRYERKSTLFYTYRGRYSFGAGKEFRYLDMRSLESLRDPISEIKEEENTFELTLFSDIPRFNRSFLREPDMNGNFVIENIDNNGNVNLRSDYADILFSLKKGQSFEDKDVYILGRFNQWTPDDRYKMVYNDLIRSYVAKLKLKQGVYDYMYAVTPKDKKTPIDVSELEGDWYEAENDYTIFIYFTPFGERYSRLVGVSDFNIIDNNSVNNR